METDTAPRLVREHSIDHAIGQHKGYFFTPGAMRFFRSRIAQSCFQADGSPRIYFATSEQFDERSGRFGTVRVLNTATGSIDQVGAFQEHANIRAAGRAAKRAAMRDAAEGS